ncbi:hypothetical protein GGR44_000343 [Sphingobium fontiphilum]|uniref:Uncharacterized protein n=1 Tax=Sphingobium fontiphilum TaxID=944425 RepID=A0A7W6DHH6_9SPHN|nr:hypothetical protein [Sphingobium fontiphilum]
MIQSPVHPEISGRNRTLHLADAPGKGWKQGKGGC